MISESEANDKVKEGWIKAWMAFEVLAINEKTAKESLEGLINNLDNSKRGHIYKKHFADIRKVDKPIKNIEVAYSLTSDVELVSKNFESLVMAVIEFGPSAIEILKPLNLNIKAGEGQKILNTISHMMHRFAAAGLGGLLLLKDKV